MSSGTKLVESQIHQLARGKSQKFYVSFIEDPRKKNTTSNITEISKPFADSRLLQKSK